MSAFMCGYDHVNAMLTAAATFCRGPMSASILAPGGNHVPLNYGKDSDAFLTMIGKALVAENIKSLQARYPGDYQELVGDEDEDGFVFDEDVRFSTRADLNKAAIVLANCYSYQSCEHDEWEGSYAKQFADWLIATAASRMSRDVNDCWEYHRDRSRPAMISLSSLAARR
jgi:hypothetical protein